MGGGSPSKELGQKRSRMVPLKSSLMRETIHHRRQGQRDSTVTAATAESRCSGDGVAREMHRNQAESGRCSTDGVVAGRPG